MKPVLANKTIYTQNGVKPDFSQMTNYAFQGVGRTLNLITALAIHLIKCAAKAHARQDKFNIYSFSKLFFRFFLLS